MRQRYYHRIALSFTLGIASNVLGQAPVFTTLDFPGATTTQAWGINSRGDIVGNYVNADKSAHAFLLSGGKYTAIDFPDASATELYGINSAGDVVGVYTLDGKRRGFLLKKGQFTKIDFPGADTTETSAITPRDDIVGFYVTADKVTHGYLLSGDQYSTIDYPGATFTLPSGINAQGDVSGSYGTGHAYLWSDGEFTAFDVPGSTFTNTTGLNARGDIVGRYLAGGVSHGYLLSGGQFNTIDFPGAVFSGATSINQRGDILGRYRNADGIFHGFLLTGSRPGCVIYAPRVAVTGGGVAVTHSADFTLVTAAKPAAAGEALSLFASGLGPTRPGVDPGQPFPTNPPAVVASSVEVRVNGKPAELLGAVGLPGAVDGYQVNFRVPADTGKGMATIQVSVGMVIDTSASIMVQ